MDGHMLILDQMWVRQEGAGSHLLSCPRFQQTGGPQTSGLRKETFASRWRSLALSRDNWPQQYISEKSMKASFREMLPSLASSNSRPQRTNHKKVVPSPLAPPSRAQAAGMWVMGTATSSSCRVWGNLLPCDLVPMVRADWPSGATWP